MHGQPCSAANQDINILLSVVARLIPMAGHGTPDRNPIIAFLRFHRRASAANHMSR